MIERRKPQLEDLLEERDFVRALARRLTVDAHTAEDAEQQLWLQAMQHPPQHAASLRGWLSRVLTNIVRNNNVASNRRTYHEHRRDPFADVDPVDLELERESIRGSLAGALSSLSPEYEAIIRLRFLEDRTTKEIASDLELPVNTVYTRLRRGLAHLREKLDREYAGDRAAWTAALVAWVAFWPKKSFWTATTAAAAGVLILTGGSLIALAVGMDGPAPDRSVRAAWLHEDTPQRVVAEEPAVVSERESVGLALVATEAAPVPELAVRASSLSIRAAWSDSGEPISDLTVRLEPQANTGIYGAIATVTDREGNAAVDELAPGTWILRPERGPWRWLEVATGEELDEELTISRVGRDVSGVVVDNRGAPVAGAEIWVSSPGTPNQGRVQTQTNDEGWFELTDLDPSAWLTARRAPESASARFLVESLPVTAEGNASQVTLAVERMPASIHGRVVDPDGMPIPGAKVAAFVTQLTAPSLDTRGWVSLPFQPDAVTTDALGRFELGPLPRMRPVLDVSADGFETLRLSAYSIHTSPAVGAELTLARTLPEDDAARASIAGRAVSEDGEALAGWTVEAELASSLPGNPISYATGNRFGLSRTLTDADGRFALASRRNEPYVVRLLAPATAREPESASAWAWREDVYANDEELLLTAATSAGPAGSVRGRLVSDGTIDCGAADVLLSSGALAHSLRVPTDGAGDFAFDSLAPGAYTLSTRIAGTLWPHFQTFEVAAEGETDLGLVEIVPPGSLRLRVFIPGGREQRRYVAHLRRASEGVRFDEKRDSRLTPKEERGDQVFENLLPGTYNVEARLGNFHGQQLELEVVPGEETLIELTIREKFEQPVLVDLPPDHVPDHAFLVLQTHHRAVPPVPGQRGRPAHRRRRTRARLTPVDHPSCVHERTRRVVD